MSIPMAIVDYIPVALFLAGALVLQQDLYHEMSKGAFALFSAGTITVFMAGFFKATWKLLYAASVCDFEPLNKCFFPMQTTGFVLAGMGAAAMLLFRQGRGRVYSSAAAAVPLLYKGTMLFVALMVLGVGALDVSLMVLAARRGRKAAVPVLIVSLLFVLGMGYLSSKDFSQPAMNWVAECVNIVGQGAFFLGARMLRKQCAAAA